MTDHIAVRTGSRMTRPNPFDPKEHAMPPMLDLRHLTRADDGLVSTVQLTSPEGWKDDQGRWCLGPRNWLLLRAVGLSCNQGTGTWSLRAKLGPGCPTDFEHDTANVVSFDLIGVQLGHIGYGGVTHIKGWIRPDSPEHFLVPPVGYDPFVGAKGCKTCKGDKKHLIVAEGFYVPPFNREIWEMVRGWQATVIITPEGAPPARRKD